MTQHTAQISREKLATWFDAYYEEGEPGVGRFSWHSDLGAQCYEGLRTKNLIFLRHCESTYQVKAFGADNIQRNPAYADARLTERGKVQAAGLALRLGLGGFRPQLIVSSPLTRCLETAALAFPADFDASARPGHWGVGDPADVKVLSQLLPEICHSWGDTGRPLDEVCNEHPQLERFRTSESSSRFQYVNCDKSQPLRPRRWSQSKQGNPVEPRDNARRRAALVWRWLSENRPEQHIALVTHSKMIMESEAVCLCGPGIAQIANGDVVTVLFE